MWENPNKAESFEPLGSQGFISTEEVVSLPEGNARQDNSDIPQDPIIVTSRPIKLSKFRAEIESVVHEEVHHTTKKFADSLEQKSGECVWEWIFRV